MSKIGLRNSYFTLVMMKLAT